MPGLSSQIERQYPRAFLTANAFARVKSVFLTLLAAAQVESAIANEMLPAYSPPIATPIPQQVYWGDLHLHTNNSVDAFSLGTTNSLAADAYRFAQGQELIVENGVRAKLRRPLDFLAVTDHGEFLGVLPRIAAGDLELLKTEVGRRWYGYMQAGQDSTLFEEILGILNGTDPTRLPDSELRAIWHDVVETAEEFYQPGFFTTFAAYEWTSAPRDSNLHRVVLFKEGTGRSDQVRPFSAQDSEDPEALWAFLAKYEREVGGEVIAIPHNANLSSGLMFAAQTLQDQPFTKQYAETRARWEPLYEVTQVKGDSETHPVLSPEDEFADFERWDSWYVPDTPAKKLPANYSRSALKQGLEFNSALGANPFKFGMIGSTDGHNGVSTADEDNFFGKFVNSEPSPERFRDKVANAYWDNWLLSASGLAAVWAEENTRESLFEALKRKEVYATTGPRITVRVFGGWDFDETDVLRSDFVDIGYRKGVPMGGDLAQAQEGATPKLLVYASKDPLGANLDRIQVVKGWLDNEGESQERVYDVALSDGRGVDLRTGRAPPVGNTVDVADASYANSIGASTLSTVWTDPEFSPTQHAFYYARILEIPTPRWTAYDAKFYKLDLPDEVPVVIQDRAYTSPIWYTP
jgi:hypothetical protein